MPCPLLFCLSQLGGSCTSDRDGWNPGFLLCPRGCLCRSAGPQTTGEVGMDRAGLWAPSSLWVLPALPWVREENGSIRDEAKQPLSPAAAGLAGQKEGGELDRGVSQRGNRRSPQWKPTGGLPQTNVTKKAAPKKLTVVREKGVSVQGNARLSSLEGDDNIHSVSWPPTVCQAPGNPEEGC